MLRGLYAEVYANGYMLRAMCHQEAHLSSQTTSCDASWLVWHIGEPRHTRQESKCAHPSLCRLVLQVLLPLVPLLSPAVLLPLFSHSSAHRVSILTVLHAQLLPSLPHDAISVPLAAASSPPPRLPIAISAPSPFSPGDMKVFHHNVVRHCQKVYRLGMLILEKQVVEVPITFLVFTSMTWLYLAVCVRLYAT